MWTVRGGPYRGRMDTAAKDRAAARPKTYGPVQVPKALGLARWEWQRALDDGLIPTPAVPAGPGCARWTQDQLDDLLARRDEIKNRIGDVCDLGAWNAAEVLSDRLGVEADPDAVVELARAGLLERAGFYKHHQLYSGRSIAAFRDAEAYREAAKVGCQRNSDQAAAYMEIRRPDFDHLFRAGRIKAVGSYRGQWKSTVLVFRTGDLDALLADEAYDWPAIRATPRGRASALAKLPSATPRSPKG
jgi:hypothetical protein